MTCRITDCDRPVYVQSRGWCSRHYNRWSLTGHPETPVSRIYFDDERRFWSKVDKAGSGGCWLWSGTTHESTGGTYGRFALQGGRRVMAHRWSYEHLVGAIADRMELDHLCRVTLCVNPDHLEPVTHAENVRRENAALGRDTGCFRCGCDKPNRCYGMCNAHYLQWKKAGRPALV